MVQHNSVTQVVQTLLLATTMRMPSSTTVRACQMMSVAFAAVMALLKALATVTETFSTLVAFAAVTAVLAFMM